MRNLTAPARDTFSQNASDVGIDEDVSETLPAGKVNQQVDSEAQVVEDLKHHLQNKGGTGQLMTLTLKLNKNRILNTPCN